MNKARKGVMLKAPPAPERRDQPEGAAAPPAPRPRVFLPALLTGALLWLCYFPVAWGWLAWVALVPLLCLVRSAARPRRVYLAAWLSGAVFFGAALSWFTFADNWILPALGGALALYCSLYFPVAVWLLRRLDRAGSPLILSLPAVWTGLEFVRAHLMTGFPWYFLAHTQHAMLPLIQVSDLGGAYAVSILVAAANALAFEWLAGRPRFQRHFGLAESPARTLRWQAAGVGVLLAATCAYGFARLGQEDFTPGPRVALVQTYVGQEVKNQITDGAVSKEVMESMLEQSRRLSDEAVRQKADLIVWPETSYPDWWLEWDPALPAENVPAKWLEHVSEAERQALFARPDWRQRLALGLNRGDILNKFSRWPTSVLVGITGRLMTDDDPWHGRRTNSAVLLRLGEPSPTYDRYDKIHRVPFGEYIPCKDWLPFVSWLSPYAEEYNVYPGQDYTRLALGRYHFGVLICFEDTDTYLARQYVRQGTDPVDFLVNISNDGWYNGSAEHDEHLAICRFRAVECRRSIARSVNKGISAVIDGSGRVVALPAKDWAASKKVSALVTADIPLDRRGSLYAALGDWLPAGCWLLVGAGLVASYRRRGETPAAAREMHVA